MASERAELKKRNAEQAARIAMQREQIDRLITENRLLQRKVQFLLKRMFGSKSEQVDPRQLELLLRGLDTPEDGDDEDPPPRPPRPGRKRRDRKPRVPENLPTQDVVIDDPQEVRRDPNAYRCIGEEVTRELDVVPAQYFVRQIIRRKFTSRVDPQRAPIMAPLPPRLVEGGYASAGLLTDIVLKKYVDHLPLYRQEQILRTRHGIDLSRKTMSDWVRVVADWLQPIYQHIREDLRASGYLQVDETPVRYCQREGGGSGKGYLWVYHRPGGDVLYEWYTSRAARCLEGMLGEFRGTVQCDGYSAYASYAKQRPQIELAACWAHVRRRVHEALDEAPALAGWLLNQIAHLYRTERAVRTEGPASRQAVRAAHSAMTTRRLEKVLRLKLPQHRPTSAMGSAIHYALSLWPQLLRFLEDGRLEIDNNLIENAIRPTAVGKKNYLFFGHPDAGQRSAILYTLLESCKRHGINPQLYLHDVLRRLPSMTNQQTRQLTPANWLAAKSAAQAA